MMGTRLPTDPERIAAWLRERGADRLVGMETRSCDIPSRLKGRIRETPEDFIVSEVLRNGSVATSLTYRMNGEGDIPLYVLSKTDLDAITAIREFSAALGLKPWGVKHLGLKDKRAMTYQFIFPTRFRGKPPPKLRGGKWEASMHTTLGRPLRPLDLCGNLFWILIRLRDPVPTPELQGLLSEFTRRVCETGLLNFFGPQRFGGRRPINHVAGYLIARRDYDAAAEVILGTPSDSDDEPLRRVRTSFLEGGRRGGFQALVRSPFILERTLVKNLIRYEGNSRESILKLPSYLLRFLLESFSAFLFNLAVSRMKGGLLSWKAQEGMLYVPLDDRASPLTTCVRATPSSLGIIEDDLNKRKAVPAVVCPGFLVERALAKGLEQIMGELGVSCGSFHLRERPEAGYPGQVRAAVAIPKTISAAPTGSQSVFLRFFLPRSSYATVLLRELLAR
jgi:TruD family tRNA pseudouridine synthase